jgi:methyl-accepting chemotaxis protein
MIKKIYNKILEPYQDARIEMKKKAKILLFISVIMLFVMVMVSFTIFITEYQLSTLINYALIPIVYIFSIISLAKNKYTLASNLVIIANGIVASIFIIFGEFYQGENAMSIYSFVMIFTILGSALIGNYKQQPIIVAVISMVGLVILLFYKTGFTTSTITSSISQAVFIWVSAFFSYKIIQIMKEVVNVAESESEINESRYEELKNILESSRVGMEIGEELTESTKVTLRAIREIDESLESIKNETLNLNEETKHSKQNSDTIITATSKVRNILDEQTSLISESSSSIEEMTTSINNISGVTKSKKDSIDQLVHTTKEGEEEMNKAIESINRISESSSNLLDVIKVIVNVASQTNLLAMNASIEAAHAGESGAGFGVVADEIRKLAEDTSQNTKIITDTLKKNINDINQASEINKKAGEYFHKINNEVKEVEDAMEEIIAGMNELSSGTNDVMKAVSNLLELSGKTNQAVDEMTDAIDANQKGIKTISELARKNEDKVEDIVEKFNSIIKETKNIREIGEENIKNIENLNTKLNKMGKQKDDTENPPSQTQDDTHLIPESE